MKLWNKSWHIGHSSPRYVAMVAAVAGLVAPLAFVLPGGQAQAAVTSEVGAASSVQAAGVPSITETWSRTVADAGTPIAMSSPVVADLPGGPAAVVGDREGNLLAYNLSSGALEWKVTNGGIGIDAAPSAANVGGGADSVFVGVGYPGSDSGKSGYYEAVNPNGTIKWQRNATNPSTDPQVSNGVRDGMAIGTLQGQTAVVSGSMGQNEAAFNAASGAELPGFPWLEADSDFSTPAIADVEGNGVNQIIEGGDSTYTGVNIYGQVYNEGGHIRILNQTAAEGTTPNGGLVCEFNTDQAVQSSPAVGEFLEGGAVGVVDGTSAEDAGKSQTNLVLAINKSCGLVWQAALNGSTASSPALADVLGNGALQVVEGTLTGSGNTLGGSVYALNGANGSVIWRHDNPTGAAIFGSVVTVDLGGGYQDVLDPTTAGLYILDGRTGDTVAKLQTPGLQNAPLVTDDPNGTIGITVAGYDGSNAGTVDHFEVSGSHGSKVNEAGAWPEFHHDAQLSGNAGTPAPVKPAPCKAPSVPNGYLEAASDGGVFNFGNLPYCGSAGSLALNKPVVSVAATANGGGYWLVASDGGIFTYGNARFYGSAGSYHLNKPIVAMATTPNGGGYYLVASDGGIFTFGDAKFYGSAGSYHLNKPIVGMAVTPDGGGYWLVASDGGIFAFGDAKFYGSTGSYHLNKPIVGMASDTATGGYWLVASDGGIFAYRAPFMGSMGGHPLNKPIVGMSEAPGGHGYRMVASDGGLFTFGSAPFMGSMGGHPLNAAIVAMTSA